MHSFMEALVVWRLLSLEMVTVAQVQILDKAVSLSHSANTLGKGMNPNILLPSMNNLLGRLDSFTTV